MLTPMFLNPGDSKNEDTGSLNSLTVIESILYFLILYLSNKII